jgi:hypothetical protein
MNARVLITYSTVCAIACVLLAAGSAPATEADEAHFTVVRGLQMYKVGDAAGVSDDIKNKGGKGPNANKYVDLFTQFDIPNPDRILSLSDRIYFDLEEASGFYYYGPRGYSLAQDPDLGHLFRIRYGMVTAGEAAGTNNVAVAFTLTGGWTKPDYELLKYLLNKYLEREHLPPCEDLKALPFHTCAFTFGAASSYGVPDEQISVPVLTDIAGFMDVTLTTDEQTVEGLKVGLQDIQGLSGKVRLVTASTEGEGIGFAIPELSAHVSLCDTKTYQREPYVRNQPFENKHDFPVRLKALYFLVDAGDDVKVFEYDLGDTLVLPGQRANLRHDHVHAGLADRAIRGWYEYRLVNEGDDIQGYWDTVMKRLTVGLGKKTVKTLTLEVLDEDLFDEYGVELVKVKVRSKHFDPNSKTVLTKNYTLDADEPEAQGDALFFLEGEEQEGISYFEYKIYMIDANGDVKRDSDWRAGVEDDEGIYIGRRHFTELMGGTGDEGDTGDDDSGDADEEDNGDNDE